MTYDFSGLSNWNGFGDLFDFIHVIMPAFFVFVVLALFFIGVMIFSRWGMRSAVMASAGSCFFLTIPLMVGGWISLYLGLGALTLMGAAFFIGILFPD